MPGKAELLPEYADPQARKAIPDPVSEQTFQSAKLIWSERDNTVHGEVLAWYRRVLSVRNEKIVPVLPEFTRGGKFGVDEDGVVVVRWEGASGAVLSAALNLSGTSRLLHHEMPGRLLWLEGRKVGAALAPWTVMWTLKS